MQIAIARGLDGAAAASGQVVIIDVLRAATTAAFALAAGAADLTLVASADEAFALRRADPSLLLAGESGGRPIPGFDLGNSPAEVLDRSLAGRRLVLRTSSGTQGVVRAAGAAGLWLASLVTAGATAACLRRTGDAVVTLVAMGSPAGPDGAEDDACAAYLAALLAGAEPDREATLAAVFASPAARQALDPAIDWIRPADLACALALDRFDFAVKVERRPGRLVAIRAPAAG